MDLSFNSRMETYYQKFIELQEKLRNSEEERLKLEMKFNDMVQVAKEEEQLHYKKLRSQYKRFLEEDRKRQERNERIIRTLERIETRISMLASKTERFRMLRHQYQSYLQRISHIKPTEKRENPPPLIVVNAPRQSNTSHVNKDVRDIEDINTTLDKSNDEKIEILDKYLHTLSSQKCREAIQDHQKDPYSDKKFLNDISKKFEKSFDSNQANSIAEDIMNSIYSRHYRKELTKEDSLKKDKFSVSDHLDSDTKTENIPEFSEFDRNRFTSSKLHNLSPYNFRNKPLESGYEIRDKPLEKGNDCERAYIQKGGDIQFANKNNTGFKHLNTNLSTPYMDPRITEKDALNAEHLSNEVDKNKAYKNSYENCFNKDTIPRSPLDITQHGNDREQDHVIVSKVDLDKDISKDPLDSYSHKEKHVKNISNFSFPDKVNISLPGTKNGLMEGKNVFKDEETGLKKSDSKKDYDNDLSLSKSEIDVAENEKYGDSKKVTDDAEDEFIDTDKQECVTDIDGEEKSQEITLPEKHKYTESITNEMMYNAHGDYEAVKHTQEGTEQVTNPKISTEDPKGTHEDPINHLPNESEIAESEKQHNEFTSNMSENKNQSKVENISEAQNNEPDTSSTHNNDVDQLQDDLNTNITEYNQDVQYDQYGQPIAYDQFGNQIVYDDKGEAMRPQFENIQYSKNEQPFHEGMHYEDSSQLAQQAYNEDAQGIQHQQYDENGQSNLYNQPYNDSNQAVQFYEENGEITKQYDQNGQAINQYDQQYDENGQPLQYDENGQVIQEYDENGQPIDMYNQPLQYDANGQPIVQYDENGQPIQFYGEDQREGQQYQQSFQQYDVNGQQFQQYDENGELVQQYNDNGDVSQYGEGIIQQEDNNQINQEYDESNQQFQVYDESVPQLNQFGESGDTHQQVDQDPQSLQQHENNTEVKDNVEDKQNDEHIHLDKESSNLINESSKDVDGADEKIDVDGEESAKSLPKARNVLDMLDTDTESVKQNTSKISNESDFDFSNG